MLLRPRRRRDGWFSIFRGKRKTGIESPDILGAAGFALAIEKERSRADRRDLSFCIIRFDILTRTSDSSELAGLWRQLALRFRDRLRITDEIGEYQSALSVLLPETIASHASKVANDLTEIAAECSISLGTDIFAFPEVDHDPLPPDDSDDSGNFRDEIHANGLGSFNGSNGLANTKPGQNDQNSNRRGIAMLAKPRQKPPGVHGNVVVKMLNTSRPIPLWKRSLDIFGASVGLIGLSPILVGTTVLIWSTSKGSAFFTQWREGKDGQLFRIYKFRTMRHGADDEKSAVRKLSEQDGPAFKLKNDPRLTGVGKYLRKCCIDELPQLVNVLKGEMSLVGPRPLPVDESLNCSRWHRRRLDVLPGMTCYWQVEGGRDIPFDEWMRMDLDYVKQCSPSTDCRLIFKTVFVTLLHRGSV